jgi:hypothetical protein
MNAMLLNGSVIKSNILPCGQINNTAMYLGWPHHPLYRLDNILSRYVLGSAHVVAELVHLLSQMGRQVLSHHSVLSH